METFLDISKYILPSLVVMITAYFLVRSFLENDQRKRESREKEEMDKAIITLRLQAYERMLLFLERIAPANLILRVSQPEMNAGQLQSVLLRTIREEFDHNLTQQLYLSDEAWQRIKNAKEELIMLINTVSARIEPDSPSHELASAMFDDMMNAKEFSVEKALTHLKKEFRDVMNQKND
ncbi:MAG: hypothetical protein PHD61_04145 [Bacteroidales bacterium]|nr:hypothetical protein [Lentimicrobiaceae bacterium]MDD5694479.1 hypothetical protein [Bacteroidales bacterium]